MADARRQPLDRLVEVIDGALGRVDDHAASAELSALRDRTTGPLRVAIAGRVKAGKSTLLNALVGERLAPTDARECTKIVTWYEYAQRYSVVAELVDGSSRELAFSRREGSLEVDLGGLHAHEVTRLRVGWPISALRSTVLIDTPGLASLDAENSTRTMDFLTAGERPSDADAVVYLMRHVHHDDIEFLDAFMDSTVSARSAMSAVGVLSRADEIGAGRLDAMESAARVARRYAADRDVRARCLTVVPVAGLLAETAQTLREGEMSLLRRLATEDGPTRERMLASVEFFCEKGVSELTAEARRDLLDRLGLFGVRRALSVIGSGSVSDAAALSADLLDISGLGEAQRLFSEHFAPRASLMKAASALAILHDIARRLRAGDPDSASWLARQVEQVEAGSVEFARARAHALVSTGVAAVGEPEHDLLDTLLSAPSDAEALGLPPGAPAPEVAERAIGEVARWRTRAADPLATPAAVEVYDVAARVCEGFHARSLQPAPAAADPRQP